MTHSLNQQRIFTSLTIVFLLISALGNLSAQSQYFSPISPPIAEEETDMGKIFFKTKLSVEATKASTSFETMDPDGTLSNIDNYAEMFIDENRHLTEITWQEFTSSGLPELRSPSTDGVLAYQTIERSGIKPQVGFGISLYNRYFNIDASIKNGKYSLMSLALEGQLGISAALLYKALDYQHNNNFIQTLISSPKIGVIAGYDGSYNPLISIYKGRNNKHVNAFIGLDFPIINRFNVYFILALDLVKREEEGGQNFTRLGTKMSF